MKAYQTTGDRDLSRVDLPDPAPGHGEVAVRVRAASLNYRDLIVRRGGYPRNDRFPTVPLSDAAGEVAAVGDGVTGWAEGERVMPAFLPTWADGPASEANLSGALGGGRDGVLAECVVVPASGVVRVPEHLSFEQAATLPCAAVTAWNALGAAGTTAGDTVLLLGTGGVSVFGLQLAKALGATVILTSGSDEKLDVARKLGADHTINYRQHPEWHERVLALTDGRGVDNVLEVGGAGTLERSLKACRVGGTVSLIGLLSNPDEQPGILPALLNAQTIRGIYVGSAALTAGLARAVTANRIEPVIDRVFGFDDAGAAYQHLADQRHVGKVVIRID